MLHYNTVLAEPDYPLGTKSTVPTAYKAKVFYEAINVAYESEDLFLVVTFSQEKMADNLKSACDLQYPALIRL